MEYIKSINVGIRFILELTLLFVFAYSSYRIFDNIFVRWFLAIALPLVVASIWGYYVAPKSQHILAMPWRSIIVVILYSLATIFLAKAGQGKLAVYFMGVFAVNEILIILWKQ
ncbi:YrdB family protein [Candidatus Saccharibacteria bacterium]|nr:YrdB family protein [Candidatus Saccharibacteria bacterium]